MWPICASEIHMPSTWRLLATLEASYYVHFLYIVMDGKNIYYILF